MHLKRFKSFKWKVFRRALNCINEHHLSSSVIYLLSICVIFSLKQHLFSFPVSILCIVGIWFIFLLPGKFFLWCGGIYGQWLPWFCHLFLSLVCWHCLFAQRKGAIFILANFDRRMCRYFVPKVIIWGSPYWAMAFEGNLCVLFSLLTWHVLHTLLCYSFVVVVSLYHTALWFWYIFKAMERQWCDILYFVPAVVNGPQSTVQSSNFLLLFLF